MSPFFFFSGDVTEMRRKESSDGEIARWRWLHISIFNIAAVFLGGTQFAGFLLGIQEVHAAVFISGSRVADTNRSPLAATNTNVAIDKNTPIVYAIEVDTTDPSRIEDPDNTTWYFRVNGGTWTQLSTTTSPAKLVASPTLVNGSTVASAERVVNTSCGTFIASLKEFESSNPQAAAARFEKGECSETQVSIDLSAANSADDFEFKIEQEHKDGTAELIGAAHVFILFPTAVKLAAFTAAVDGEGVLLRWRTGYEIDNLGFHVYREAGAEVVRLTPELVAGSALLAGAGTALTAGTSYSWWDDMGMVSGQPSAVRYWLEDVDLSGKGTWHGPVTPVLTHEGLPKKIKPELLTEFSRRLNGKYDDFWRGHDLKAKLGRDFPAGPIGSARVVERTSKAFDQKKINQKVTQLDQPSQQAITTQWSLASGPAVKLLVKEEGWYRVSETELRAAGLSPTVNPRHLQLYMDGREQPIKVLSKKSGRSNSLLAIEFYGVGLDTPSTDTRAYWLIEGSMPGKRIEEFKGRKGRLLAPPSFPYTIEKKERTFYFAALKNGEAESFFGPMVTAEPLDQVLVVSHLDPSAAGEVVLEVALQGLTNLPHRVKVLFNEVEAGEVIFEGQSRGSITLSILQSYLLDGENLVTLVSEGGEMDVSLIDEIRLTYWHTYTADGDILRMTAEGGEQLTIDGFSQSPIRVLDITNPRAVHEVAGVVEPKGSGYAIRVEVPGSDSRILLAFTETKVMRPAFIAANQPSRWHQRGKRADLVIIAHMDFLENVEPLKALRQAQGLSVALIDAEDLYDEFNFGAKSPAAIKDFLALTKANSNRSPRFVLLVGDASFDPKNYLGFGNFDFVPTKLVETAFLKTASDDWFVDFNGDGLPEMAVGRLPVRTAEEAATVISKIISYEQGAGGMLNEALLVADKNDVFDFERANQELEALLPSSIRVQKIFRGNFGTDEEAKSTFINSMNEGSSLVNYVGHGSVEILRGLLSSDDAQSLTNGARLPFFISMTCLNGFFHDVFTESLAETLLKAEGGGAVTVWASSGLTEPGGQAVMDRELIRLLFNGEQLTLGEATARAKARVTDPDIRRTWILFGDPTTRLKTGS
jgi:hypothetical protein